MVKESALDSMARKNHDYLNKECERILKERGLLKEGDSVEEFFRDPDCLERMNNQIDKEIELQRAALEKAEERAQNLIAESEKEINEFRTRQAARDKAATKRNLIAGAVIGIATGTIAGVISLINKR